MYPKIISYTRSRESNGRVESYHMKDIANTVHTATGSGGNTDQFVLVPCILTPRPASGGNNLTNLYR